MHVYNDSERPRGRVLGWLRAPSVKVKRTQEREEGTLIKGTFPWGFWGGKWTDMMEFSRGQQCGSDGTGGWPTAGSTRLRLSFTGKCEKPQGETSHLELINTYSRKCLRSAMKTTWAVMLYFLLLTPAKSSKQPGVTLNVKLILCGCCSIFFLSRPGWQFDILVSCGMLYKPLLFKKQWCVLRDLIEGISTHLLTHDLIHLVVRESQVIPPPQHTPPNIYLPYPAMRADFWRKRFLRLRPYFVVFPSFPDRLDNLQHCGKDQPIGCSLLENITGDNRETLT